MASSGSFNTSSYSDSDVTRYLTFSWSIQSQSVANNSTTISWTLKGAGNPVNTWVKAGGFKVVIDGDTAYSTSTDTRINLYGNTTIASGTKTIIHNADGTRNFTVSAQGAIYYYAVNCKGSSTFALDKIARNPNAPTAFSITAGYGNYCGLGDTITLKWSGASGVITGYQIQYSRGNSGWKDFKTITSSTTSGSTTDSFTSTDINVNGAGCAVKYRIRAMNGSLASDWKEANVLYITGGMDLKVSSAWKTGSVWIKVGGTWKRAKRVWIKVNGSWQYSK